MRRATRLVEPATSRLYSFMASFGLAFVVMRAGTTRKSAAR